MIKQESGELHYQHRHYSHYVPRDFDLSPYFRVVKPSLELGFDFHKINWSEGDEAREELEQKQAQRA